MKTIPLLILFFSILYSSAFASSTSLELVSTNFTGNTNGIFSPGGTFGLSATITTINQPATDASATLSSSDSCVTIIQNNAVFGNISLSQNISNSSSPFQFSISPTCPAGHLINLDLTLAATAYSSSPIIIPVLVSIPNAPYINPPYTCITNYYVSTNGSDSNDGSSAGEAWYSIAHAISYLKGMGGTHGGVCVNVQPGTYLGYNYANGLSGSSDTPGGYLVFRSMMLHGATVQVPATDVTNPLANSFRFDQEHFIVVDGFNIAGQSLPGSIENGVVSNSYGTPGDHMKVLNNIISNHGGSGVGATHTDYLTIEGNIVFGNANTSPGEMSGISAWQAVASDLAPGFHNIISDNIVFNNAEVNDGHSVHTDGNGIVIDDFRNTQNNSTYGAYSPGTLVENNLVFENAGRGIHVFSTDNVTVLNNTTYENELDPVGLGTWRSELDVVNGSNATFVNNIAYAKQVTNEWNAPNVCFMDNSTNNSNLNNKWHNNLSFNGANEPTSIMISGSPSTITAAQGNLLGLDPKFGNPSTDDFTLQAKSPAIDAGTNTYGYPATDLAGNIISPNAIDMGAFQYINQVVNSLNVSNSGTGFGMVFGSTPTSSNLINCGVNAGANLCSAPINSGTAVTLTATPSSTSIFNGWTVAGSASGTCTGTNSPCLFTINAPTNVTANFTPQTIVLTVNAGINGSISPSGTINVPNGSNQTFTLTPNNGYVASLTIDGSAVTLTNNTYTLNDITANHSIEATFNLPPVTINAGFGGGGIIIPYGNISVNYGGSQAFTLKASTGYNVAQLTVDGLPVQLTNDTYTLLDVTKPHMLKASFIFQTETLTASAGANGTISPSGSINLNYGSSQTFSVTPNAGYTATLTVDGTPATLTNNTFTLGHITKPHTVMANFISQS